MDRIVGIIKDVAADVAAILAFIAVIMGTSNLPYPRTAAGLTLILLAVALWVWRWPAITRQVPAVATRTLLVVGERKKRNPPFWQLLVDPLRSASLRSYVRPVFSRRSEAMLLVLLALFSIGWSSFHLKALLAEWGHVDCPASPAKYTVAIADIGENSPENINFKKRLIEEIDLEMIADIQICDVPLTISTKEAAQALGKRAPAAIVIWGRSDKDLIDVNVEPIASNVLNQQEPVPPDEFSTFQERGKGLYRTAFLTKVILSVLYMQQGDFDRALQILQPAVLDATYTADQEGWSPKEKKDLGKGYFILGLLLSDSETKPDYKGAVKAYGKAIELYPRLDAAVLNRGFLYETLGEDEKAKDDFTTLIDENSPLSGTAYINRASLQHDCTLAEQDLNSAIEWSPDQGYAGRGELRISCGNLSGAIADLREALKFTPRRAYLYQLLGKAYLLDKQVDQAKQTYKDAIPYLNKVVKQGMIDDLQVIVNENPDIAPAINDIRNFINEALVK